MGEHTTEARGVEGSIPSRPILVFLENTNNTFLYPNRLIFK